MRELEGEEILFAAAAPEGRPPDRACQATTELYRHRQQGKEVSSPSKKKRVPSLQQANIWTVSHRLRGNAPPSHAKRPAPHPSDGIGGASRQPFPLRPTEENFHNMIQLALLAAVAYSHHDPAAVHFFRMVAESEYEFYNPLIYKNNTIQTLKGIILTTKEGPLPAKQRLPQKKTEFVTFRQTFVTFSAIF